MKKKQIIDLKITDMSYKSTGISEYDGKKVTIRHALIGQEVKAQISRVRETNAKAKIVEVLKPADYEVDSFCSHFGKCGGCSRQTVPYSKQLELKSYMVDKLLKSYGVDGYDYEEIVASPEIYQYRNKMEFSFGDEEKGGELTLGMHKKGMRYDVVTVDQCQIVDSDFGKILKETLEFCKEKNISKYNKIFHTGVLRHFIVRKGLHTGEILIGLSAVSELGFDVSDLIDRLLNLPLKGDIVGFLHIKNDEKGDMVQGDIDVLYGRDYYYEKLFDLKFKVSFKSFFQTNTSGAEALYSKVLEYLPAVNNHTVFDLFSGTGTIGQIVSKNAKKVISIEIIEDAVLAAKENAVLNNISNCDFIAGDVFKELNKIDIKPDTIVVDPPRAGISKKAVRKISKYGVDSIIYVSCNPRTLAENLAQFKELGYETKKVCCVDMFPHTPHVETIALLRYNTNDL